MIREFPTRFAQAMVSGAATALYFMGAAFAAATIVGVIGNPVWRWGCFLWNLWP